MTAECYRCVRTGVTLVSGLYTQPALLHSCSLAELEDGRGIHPPLKLRSMAVVWGRSGPWIFCMVARLMPFSKVVAAPPYRLKSSHPTIR